MSKRALKTCDECGSGYVADTSRMAGLCPECAHWIYGYAVCEHAFVAGHCTRCHWDGATSDYVQQLKQQRERPASAPPADTSQT